MTDILNPGKRKKKKEKSVIHATIKKKVRIQLFASYRQQLPIVTAKNKKQEKTCNIL